MSGGERYFRDLKRTDKEYLFALDKAKQYFDNQYNLGHMTDAERNKAYSQKKKELDELYCHLFHDLIDSLQNYYWGE